MPAKIFVSENSPSKDYFQKQKILQGQKTIFFLQGPKLKRVIFAGMSAIFKPFIFLSYFCVYSIMDSLKRKVSANPPSTNNEGQSSKASWRDLKATEYFVKACLDQVIKGQRVGTCFTKKGWQGIVSQFNEQSGLNYDKVKLKIGMIA